MNYPVMDCPDSGRAAEQTERRPPDSVSVSRSAGGVRRGRNGTRCGKSTSAEPSPSLQTAIFPTLFPSAANKWPRRWLINPGKGDTANSFMSWRKWLYAVEPGTYCPTFNNKNWMCFAKSLTVASGEIPFSSQERNFLLSEFAMAVSQSVSEPDAQDSTSVFPSRPQLLTRYGSISGRSPRSSRRHIAVEASALRSGRFTVRTLQREESTILPF